MNVEDRSSQSGTLVAFIVPSFWGNELLAACCRSCCGSSGVALGVGCHTMSGCPATASPFLSLRFGGLTRYLGQGVWGRRSPCHSASVSGAAALAHWPNRLVRGVVRHRGRRCVRPSSRRCCPLCPPSGGRSPSGSGFLVPQALQRAGLELHALRPTVRELFESLGGCQDARAKCGPAATSEGNPGSGGGAQVDPGCRPGGIA